MDIDTCSLPKKSVVGEASVRKKAASLPKTILNDKASARFNALHQNTVGGMRVFKQESHTRDGSSEGGVLLL